MSRAFSRERAGRIGVELEWLVYAGAEADSAPAAPGIGTGTPDRTSDTSEQKQIIVDHPAAVLDRGDQEDRPVLPAGGTISREPGGQLELSTLPADSLGACAHNAAADLAALRAWAGRRGLTLRGHGLDDRPPRLRVTDPRYVALDRYYRNIGAGPVLLCSTASVQVNVDAGDGSAGWRGRTRRWALANGLGPVLTAMFANSPAVQDGVPVRSARQLLRLRTDPARSGPLPLAAEPRALWAEYALATRVVSVRSPGTGTWDAPPPGLTLRTWLRGAGPRPVYAADVFNHLKSLVAPVRACGHLELRMIDAQPDDDWVVPLAVVGALLDEEGASEAAWRLVTAVLPRPGRALWLRAAADGLSDPELAAAARTVMAIATAGLARLDAPPWLRDAVAAYADHYTARGRSPADTRSAGYAVRPVSHEEVHGAVA
ncbi:glutamate-cysteine ligase family protein [Actinacidiphila acididurans]|uniref:Glutamate--cysteine ligase EgtA n=1 Tax=Actinacidiphila acididurans TaxID=2784346 RepID=A0ABS2TMD6_9ACTN|nr:glutamate-cysteine ligase family protein [Actinacidiphila acididurans]MBM9504501.1 ergothioneine biosynthesis glutamate--cysteine ligase EgtA [Actinacidiphila acididurans]